MNNTLTWTHSVSTLRRWTRCLLLLTLLSFSVTEVMAQPPVKVATAAELAADTRLQKTVTLDETGIPLADLLKKLSHTELSLSAGRSCADLKLQIRLKQRPLHALLHALAQLLPGYWEPLDNKQGYRLSMKGSAISRRENWWHLFLTERERAIAAQRAFLLQQMRGEPFRRKPGDPNPENSDPAIEEQFAKEHEFFRDLPAALQETLVNQQIDCPLFTMGIGSFGTGHEEGALVMPMDSLPAKAQEQLKSRAAAAFSTGDFPFRVDNAMVNFMNGGSTVIAKVETDGGRSTGAFGFSPGISPDAGALMLKHDLLAMEVKRLGAKAPDAWKKLVEYHESRVWKNDPTPKNRLVRHHHSRAEVLHWLRDKADIEYVSDYYGSGNSMTPQARATPPASPLKAELDFRAAETDTSWKQREDTIYLFRNNRWYRDDALQVPPALLKRWYAQRLKEREQAEKPETLPTVAQRIKQQMEWDTEILNSLTLWQIPTGFASYVPEGFDPKVSAENFIKRGGFSSIPGMPDPTEKHPFRSDSDRIMRRLNTIRFYSSLNDTVRNALVEGRLPFSTLTSEQREKALYLAPRLRVLIAQQPDRPLFLRLQPTAEFFFQTQPKMEMGFRRGGGEVRLNFTSTPPPMQP